jgi:heterotetrameric sarcosine oxidase gamma subunit
MDDQIFSSRSAFADFSFAAAGSANRGCVTERDGLGVSTVLLRKGQILALEQRVRECFDIGLARGPRRETSAGIAFAATGPETWLATSDLLGYAFASTLRRAIGDLASISDQSDAYAILRLTGPELRDTLARIVAVDLHPRVFRPGDVAAAVASQIGAILWRLEDAIAGAPVFEVAVPRSLAQSFSHALWGGT